MQLRKDYHVEVNEHAALHGLLFEPLARFMLGKSCVGNGKLPVELSFPQHLLGMGHFEPELPYNFRTYLV